MSDIAKDASVNFVIGDFAMVDPLSGKGSIVGAGVAVLGFDPAQGLTSRFAVWISVALPGGLLPAEFPIEIALTSNGELVNLPAQTGTPPQPLRIAQIVQLDKSQIPAPAVVRDHVGSRNQIVLDFSNGLPLSPNGTYEWQVRVDGDDSRVWSYPFAVSGPMPGPVIG